MSGAFAESPTLSEVLMGLAALSAICFFIVLAIDAAAFWAAHDLVCEVRP